MGAVAEELQIKGLTNREGNNSSNNDTPGSGGNTTNSTSSASKKHKRPAMDSQTPVKKVRRSSPAPIASSAAPVALSTSELKEDKDMVNIKDDPEVIHGMASTSAVNPDEAAEYAGEDFDESYDGYYEDEGTELGESGEATDGTKGLSSVTGTADAAAQMLPTSNFDSQMVASSEDGRGQCVICGQWYSNTGVAKVHVERMHLKPRLFQCKICQAVIRHKLDFAKHVNRKHKIVGA